MAVILTDGAQTMGPGVPIEPLAHIARRLQSQDITVLAVSVGQDVPRSQLLNLTNSIEENILEVNTFGNLLSIINQFINVSCTGKFWNKLLSIQFSGEFMLLNESEDKTLIGG